MMSQQIMTSFGSQQSNVNGIVSKKSWKIKYNPSTNVGNGIIETDGPEGYRQFIIEDIKDTDIKNVLMPKNINKNTIEEELIKILPNTPTKTKSRRRKTKTPTKTKSKTKAKTVKKTKSARKKSKTLTKTKSKTKTKTVKKTRRARKKSKTIKGLLPDKLLKTII